MTGERFDNIVGKKELTWLFLLMKVNQLNRSVKESGWRYEDKQIVYDLKDRLIQKILTENPKELKTELFYVPYYKYSTQSKDRAGELMRRDGGRQPFEYYLGQIKPGENDIEIRDKATIEVVVSCMNQTFSFHQPFVWVSELGIEVSNIPQKNWMNAENFHHTMLDNEKKDIEEFFANLQM